MDSRIGPACPDPIIEAKPRVHDGFRGPGCDELCRRLRAKRFSVMTAATVGFGDIVPLSIMARSIVILEVLLTFLYAVFLCSVLASTLREIRPIVETSEGIPDAAKNRAQEIAP